MGINDMDVKISFDNIKKRCFLFLVITFYCGFIWLAYYTSMPDVIDLVESRSIVYYFWGSFIGMLFIPALCYFAFVFVFVFFTKNLQAPKLLAKGITLAYHYFGVVFIIGMLLSFIVIFYPLGTNYVLCERPGPFSGTYYTRTEEICTQVKYLLKTRARDIKKLNDQLDGVSSQ
ncbi:MULTISPECIES: DUF1240 domain-containing protein [Enterobacter cloacae complex]|uniref:DUF1240 domain-containing protein n=1 Tax=Enterobacter cloacae complex TaxID=354276 RepID=UPI001D0BEB2C|nr:MULTISPECIES: DUF1240 domain-containing protein [Enterobacter cloacae complex]